MAAESSFCLGIEEILQWRVQHVGRVAVLRGDTGPSKPSFYSLDLGAVSIDGEKAFGLAFDYQKLVWAKRPQPVGAVATRNDRNTIVGVLRATTVGPLTIPEFNKVIHDRRGPVGRNA